MNRRLTFTLIFAASSALAEPSNSDVERLRESYLRAIERATAPLRATYVEELRKLMEKHTKAGNLDAALAARNEIESVSAMSKTSSSQSSNVPPTGSPTIPATSNGKFSSSDKKRLESLFVGKTWAVIWDERPDHKEFLHFSKNGKGARKLGNTVTTDIKWTVQDDGSVFVAMAGFDKHITFLNAEEATMVVHFPAPKGDVNQQLKASGEPIEGVK